VAVNVAFGADRPGDHGLTDSVSNRGARSHIVMKTLFSRFVKDEAGATAIEYGLIAALIAVAIIGALTTLGGNMSTMYNNIAGKL
jgi:pilus assembly protein Flp/PilA